MPVSLVNAVKPVGPLPYGGSPVRTYRVAGTHSSLVTAKGGVGVDLAEREKNNRAVGYPTARFCS